MNFWQIRAVFGKKADLGNYRTMLHNKQKQTFLDSPRQKRCSKCLQTKPPIDFYPDPKRRWGCRSWCKDCEKTAHKLWAETEQGKSSQREATKRYSQSDKAKAANRRYRRTSGGKAAYQRANRKYRSDPEVRQRLRLATAEYGRNHSKESRARIIVYRAILRGILARPIMCSSCGRGGRILCHHEDYDKPLDIVGLCDSCHRQRHARSGQLLEVGD